MYFYAIARDFSVNLVKLLEQEFEKLGCSCHKVKKAEDEEMPARHVLVKFLVRKERSVEYLEIMSNSIKDYSKKINKNGNTNNFPHTVPELRRY